MASFSDPDQPARFAAQKAADDSRALRIEEHFVGSRLAGQRVLITGSNRGIGLAMVCLSIPCSTTFTSFFTLFHPGFHHPLHLSCSWFPCFALSQIFILPLICTIVRLYVSVPRPSRTGPR